MAFYFVPLLKPDIHILARILGTSNYVNMESKSHSQLFLPKSILVVSQQSELGYFNTDFFTSKIMDYCGIYKYEPKAIILDLSCVNVIDSNILGSLVEMKEYSSRRNIRLYVAQLKPSCIISLIKCGFTDKIPLKHYFDSIHYAVAFAEKETRKKLEEEEDKEIEFEFPEMTSTLNLIPEQLNIQEVDDDYE